MWYEGVGKELVEKEKALHKALNKDVEEIVKHKKVLLFKQMLEDIHYDD